jgi:cell wall-associated NlpC family hydrolase
MRSQVELEVPWIICSATETASLPPFAWGDQLEDPAPLVGRPFRHGVTDCYAAIRAWGQRERGVLLPDYPRQWEWWLEGVNGDKDMYRRNFADAGFREIDASEVRVGDVWLAQVRSPVPNHGGVYIGDGLAYHHPSSLLASDPTRLSKREPIARWQRHITHWLRRDDWC